MYSIVWDSSSSVWDAPELTCIVCEAHISTNTLYCEAHDVADPDHTDGTDASHPDRA